MKLGTFARDERRRVGFLIPAFSLSHHYQRQQNPEGKSMDFKQNYIK